MDISPRLSGEHWQDWAEKLLMRHYGPGEYQSIPDKDRGDGGIEGFTVSLGHAYQAYGPEDEPLSTNERYEKHRTKITNDIAKFITNRVLLSSLFGTVKISRWILFVPVCDSKEIVKHATKKTQEVIDANLPYVSKDFYILVQDESAFPVERDELLNANLSTIIVDFEDIAESKIIEWVDENDKFVQVIDHKVSKLPSFRTEDERHKYRNEIVKIYLDGQNALEELRKYPLAYEAVRKIKSDKERYLSLEIPTLSDSNSEILRKSLNEIKESTRLVPGVGESLTQAIAWEAIADWIIRCPLDFPDRQ